MAEDLSFDESSWFPDDFENLLSAEASHLLDEEENFSSLPRQPTKKSPEEQPTEPPFELDGFEEIFSPEALRLLTDFDGPPSSPNRLQDVGRSQHVYPSPNPTVHSGINEPRAERKAKYSTAAIPDYPALTVQNPPVTMSQRAELDPDSRAKATSIRKRGPCMNCRRSKTSVSLDDKRCSCISAKLILV